MMIKEQEPILGEEFAAQSAKKSTSRKRPAKAKTPKKLTKKQKELHLVHLDRVDDEIFSLIIIFLLSLFKAF